MARFACSDKRPITLTSITIRADASKVFRSIRFFMGPIALRNHSLRMKRANRSRPTGIPRSIRQQASCARSQRNTVLTLSALSTRCRAPVTSRKVRSCVSPTRSAGRSSAATSSTATCPCSGLRPLAAKAKSWSRTAGKTRSLRSYLARTLWSRACPMLTSSPTRRKMAAR